MRYSVLSITTRLELLLSLLFIIIHYNNVQMEGGMSPSEIAYVVIYNHPKITGQV